LPSDVSEVLAKMRKMPVVSENDLDVGLDSLMLESEDKTFSFYLKDSIMYLSEQAHEMGGLIAYTYLTPISQFDDDYVDNLGDVDLAHLSDRKKKKKEKQIRLMKEHERISKGAVRRAQKWLSDNKSISVSCALIDDECRELLAHAKYFIRRGKPDYYESQLQLMEFAVEKNNLETNSDIMPLMEILSKCYKKCEIKNQKELVDDFVGEVINPQFNPRKTASGQNKKFDFRELLAATNKPKLRIETRKQFEKEYPVKSKEIMEIYTAEEEVEQTIEVKESEEKKTTKEKEEEKTKKLTEKLLAEYEQTQQTQKDVPQNQETEQKRSKTSTFQKNQDEQAKTF